jgi:hypothetical protein
MWTVWTILFLPFLMTTKSMLLDRTKVSYLDDRGLGTLGALRPRETALA